MTTHTTPHARIEYTVEVDGQPRKDSYTTADVRDHRPSTVEVTQVVGPEDGLGVN